MPILFVKGAPKGRAALFRKNSGRHRNRGKFRREDLRLGNIRRKKIRKRRKKRKKELSNGLDKDIKGGCNSEGGDSIFLGQKRREGGRRRGGRKRTGTL